MILRARSLAKPTPAHSCEGVMSIWSNRPVSDCGTGPCLALHCAILIVHALVMYSSFMLFFLSNFYWRNLVSTLLYFIPSYSPALSLRIAVIFHTHLVTHSSPRLCWTDIAYRSFSACLIIPSYPRTLASTFYLHSFIGFHSSAI